MDLNDKMQALFEGFANQDAAALRALCADDYQARQNGSPPADFDEMIAMVSESFWNTGLTVSYGDIRRITTDRAVTEQHAVTVSRPDGVEVAVDVCVVAHFNDDGLVTALDEYVDTAQFAPLMA